MPAAIPQAWAINFQGSVKLETTVYITPILIARPKDDPERKVSHFMTETGVFPVYALKDHRWFKK